MCALGLGWCSCQRNSWWHTGEKVTSITDIKVRKGEHVGYMLRDCAWREVKKAWIMDTEGRSKLRMVKNLMEG